MPYIFTPPTVKEGPVGGHRLFQFRTLDRGITIVRVGEASYIEVRFPTEDYLKGKEYWLGGRSHIVSDEIAEDLIAGGYADYLEEI